MVQTPLFDDSAPEPPLPNIVWTAIRFEGGLVVVALVAGLVMDTPPWRLIAFSWQVVAMGLLATVPMIAGLVLFRLVRSGPLGELNRTMDQQILPLFAGTSLAALAVVSLMAGIGEELLFRGVLQQLLQHWTTPMAGLLWASLLFGLAHWITPTYAALATVVGIYFGVLWWWSDSLLAPIIAHALYDFIALAYMTRFPGGELP